MGAPSLGNASHAKPTEHSSVVGQDYEADRAAWRAERFQLHAEILHLKEEAERARLQATALRSEIAVLRVPQAALKRHKQFLMAELEKRGRLISDLSTALRDAQEDRARATPPPFRHRLPE